MLTDDIDLVGVATPIQLNAPAEEPLTLAETKAYLHIEHNTEDAIISQCILATRQMAENLLKSSLVTQSWKIAFDKSAPVEIFLPMAPVQSITSVVLIDESGASSTVAAANYYIDSSRSKLISEISLTADRVEISYIAGFGAATAVPASIKQGMLQHIASMYENRGDGGDIPLATLALYRPWMMLRVGL